MFAENPFSCLNVFIIVEGRRRCTKGNHKSLPGEHKKIAKRFVREESGTHDHGDHFKQSL